MTSQADNKSSYTEIVDVRVPDNSRLLGSDQKNVQLMPFSIDYNGEAKKMQEYFIIEKSGTAKKQPTPYRTLLMVIMDCCILFVYSLEILKLV